MSIIALIALLLNMLLFPITVGIYVYNDATKRNMNAVLWTIVAAFSPAFIGLIIYLLVRGSYSDIECPHCNTTVSEQFVVCPECRTKLKPTCSNCNAPIEENWKVCPRCAVPITNSDIDYQTPIYKKDNALGKILLVLTLIPSILTIILVFLLLPSSEDTSNIEMLSYTIDDYEKTINNDFISEWIADCNQKTIDTTAYILRYTDPEQPKSLCYLVFIPNMIEHSSSIGEGYSFPPNTLTNLTLDFESVAVNESSQEDKPLLYCVSSTTASKLGVDLEVFVDNEEYNCEITDIDTNPYINIHDIISE